MLTTSVSPETIKIVTKRIKVEIKPTKEQKRHIDSTIGSCRALYNILLCRSKLECEEFKIGRRNIKPVVRGYDFVKAITTLKQEPEYIWLNEISNAALQQSALNLGTAFSNFFKGLKQNTKTGFPQFKKKKSEGGFNLTSEHFSVREDSLFIAKCKTPIKVLWQTKSTDLPSIPSSVTVIKRPDGRYFASFVCKVPVKQTNGTKIQGLDLGLKDLIVTSEGVKYENPRYLKQIQKQLRRRNKALARKEKGSRRWKLARVKLAKTYQKLTDVRNDHYHKLSRKLVNESQVIVLERLAVKNMIRNRKLSSHIADVSWSILTKMIEYKATSSNHCMLFKVDTFYPSTQTCNHCGHRLLGEDKVKLTTRFWTCPVCKTEHDRDTNAALNLRNRGMDFYRERPVLSTDCIHLIP
jgi:putative transposase